MQYSLLVEFEVDAGSAFRWMDRCGQVCAFQKDAWLRLAIMHVSACVSTMVVHRCVFVLTVQGKQQ